MGDIRRWRPAVVIVLAVIVGVASSAASREQKTLEFELEDQFRTVHRASDFVGSVVLLIGSDRHGVEFNQGWGEAIRSALADHPRSDRVTHLAYADLEGVPFFLKGTVRGKFPRQPEHWVLMDWEGEVASRYRFTPASSNILVVAPDGALALHHAGTEIDETSVDEIAAAIERLLDEL